MYSNQIGNEGVCYLADALKSNPVRQHLLICVIRTAFSLFIDTHDIGPVLERD